jgi:molecular chaperone GrpE
MMSESSKEKEDSKESKAHRETPEEATEEQVPESSSSEASLEDKLAQLEKDQLYLRAEMENIKRNSIKERSQLLKFGAERLARDLLETLDVFKSALSSEITEDNYKEFVEGVEMTAQSLKTTLEKHGIKEMECVGKPFDPNTQEALSSEPSEELPEGHVTQVFKAPFMYHDKLLRAGQVIVSRKKTE